MKRGFSLIEMVIALGLIGVVMAAINVLLFSTLRSAKKAEAVGQSKSEGALAMQGMTQMMRFAHSVDTTTCNSDKIKFFRYVKDEFGVTRDHDITYSLTSQNQIASSSAFIIGTSLLTSSQVQVARCKGMPSIFTCTPSGAGVQVRSIGICFQVNTTATTDTTVDNGTATFQTQVTLRNVDN